MKWSALIVIAACGGGGNTSAPTTGSGSGSGSTMTATDLCELGRDALESLKDCHGKPMGDATRTAKQQFNGVIAMAKQTRSNATELQTSCAQMLHALDNELVKSGCGLPLSANARSRMYDLVEAWYATRTPVAPTGNAAADAVVARVVAIRDATCKCTTEQCLEGVQKSLDTITPFAADAPEAARTLGDKLLDDVGRCSARITKPVVRR